MRKRSQTLFEVLKQPKSARSDPEAETPELHTEGEAEGDGEKSRRHSQFLQKWFQEFKWLQTEHKDTEDLAMVCSDCKKAGKRNALTSGCRNFQRSALVRHIAHGTSAEHQK